MQRQKIERFKARVAVYLILERDGKILMLRRCNTGYQDGNYGLVQGHIDGGETVQEAMSREAKEEVNVDVKPQDIDVVLVQHEPADSEPGEEYICVYMKARTWSGEPMNCEPDKCNDMGWHAYDSLPENTIDNVRQALKNIRNGITYANWGWNR